MNNVVLQVEGLNKSYKTVQALKNLNLTVEKGSVFGLLGPNGSGKTTTLGILLGINTADSGSFSWFGNGQKDENRMRLGAILETPNFYPYLSAKQNLKTVGLIKNVTNLEQRILEVIKQVGLEGRELDLFKTYSLGMKQRLAIASALINDPEVLVLDEPTNGLDPSGIADIRELIIGIAKTGKTIIIASHILDEIEKICSHVAIMRHGQLLSSGLMGEILNSKPSVAIQASDMILLESHIKSINWVELIDAKEDHLMVSLNDDKSPADLNKALFEKDMALNEMRTVKKNLETTFLETVRS